MKPLVDIHITEVKEGDEVRYTYTAIPAARAGQPDLSEAETVAGEEKTIDLLLSQATEKAVERWGPVFLRLFGSPAIMELVAEAGRITPRNL